MPDQYSKLVGDTLKYPYLVGISTDSGDFGTGILIRPWLVLTCAHVLHDSESAEVISQEGSTSARVQKVDNSLDLALLELKRPLSAPNAKFTDSPLQPGAVLRAVGVQETPGQPDQLSVAEVELKYRNKNDAGGKILDMQLEGGARPGYSGGPVVVEQGGGLLCVGVTRHGGFGSNLTNAIGLASIRAFVPQYIPDPGAESGTKAESSRRLLIATAILFSVVVGGAVTKWLYPTSHNSKVSSDSVTVSSPQPEKNPQGESALGMDTPTDQTNVRSAPTPKKSPSPKYVAPPATVAGPGKAQGEPNVKVWVNTGSNVYHCPGTRWYQATKHGEDLTQSEAQKKGYRPAYGKVCK